MTPVLRVSGASVLCRYPEDFFEFDIVGSVDGEIHFVSVVADGFTDDVHGFLAGGEAGVEECSLFFDGLAEGFCIYGSGLQSTCFPASRV